MGFLTVENKLVLAHVGGDALVLLSNALGQLLGVLSTDGDGGVVSVTANTPTAFTVDVEEGSILSNMVVDTFRKVVCEDDIQ